MFYQLIKYLYNNHYDTSAEKSDGSFCVTTEKNRYVFPSPKQPFDKGDSPFSQAVNDEDTYKQLVYTLNSALIEIAEYNINMQELTETDANTDFEKLEGVKGRKSKGNKSLKKRKARFNKSVISPGLESQMTEKGPHRLRLLLYAYALKMSAAETKELMQTIDPNLSVNIWNGYEVIVFYAINRKQHDITLNDLDYLGQVTEFNKNIGSTLSYYSGYPDVLSAIAKIKDIITYKDNYDYKQIKDLNGLMSTVNTVKAELVSKKQTEADEVISQCIPALEAKANTNLDKLSGILAQAKNDFDSRKQSIAELDDLALLDEAIQQLWTAKDTFITEMDKALQSPKPISPVPPTPKKVKKSYTTDTDVALDLFNSLAETDKEASIKEMEKLLRKIIVSGKISSIKAKKELDSMFRYVIEKGDRIFKGDYWGKYYCKDNNNEVDFRKCRDAITEQFWPYYENQVQFRSRTENEHYINLQEMRSLPTKKHLKAVDEEKQAVTRADLEFAFFLKFALDNHISKYVRSDIAVGTDKLIAQRFHDYKSEADALLTRLHFEKTGVKYRFDDMLMICMQKEYPVKELHSIAADYFLIARDDVEIQEI
ncbi:MAG: hypothetical protein E7187_07015 [Erysipelotrichaceae bacterium]|nr:hypothetical protein [Erysipelotrichaceae bacterium]